jgi:hypothetical protein
MQVCCITNTYLIQTKMSTIEKLNPSVIELESKMCQAILDGDLRTIDDVIKQGLNVNHEIRFRFNTVSMEHVH